MNYDLSAYSQSEFLQWVQRICLDDTEQEHIDAVLHFEEVTQHPDGSDLIYYPEKEEDATPENIVRIVKEWRQSQELPCFKD